jgi:membrane protein YdbS with pleckstrin-like domain
MVRKAEIKDDEEILYQTRPNFILTNLSVIIDIILIIIILTLMPTIMDTISSWNVAGIQNGIFYLLLILILICIVFILIKLLIWSCTKYTITDSRIITKTGVISKDRTSMPYKTIQDLKIKQGVLDRLFKVGTVYLYSAYDGTDLKLSKISDPNEVEEILFKQLQHFRTNE